MVLGTYQWQNKPVKEEITEMASLFAKEDIHSVVINMGSQSFRYGFGAGVNRYVGRDVLHPG